jgi:deoxyadenosine/deoxycytidine kinase
MVVAIEGSIGVGKSTVINILEKRGFTVQCEPVAVWTLLEKLYTQPKDYAALFELQVLASYANQKPGLQVLERSAESALHVFARMLHTDGSITDEQMELVRAAYKLIPHRAPTKFIYLQADLNLCQRRIAWRGRSEESSVQLEYLQRLEAAYAAFLSSVDSVVIQVHELDSPDDIADKIVALIFPDDIVKKE